MLASTYKEEHPEVEVEIGGPRRGPEDYQEMLLNTKFSICPRGLHPETFRLYESLEAG